MAARQARIHQGPPVRINSERRNPTPETRPIPISGTCPPAFRLDANHECFGLCPNFAGMTIEQRAGAEQ